MVGGSLCARLHSDVFLRSISEVLRRRRAADCLVITCQTSCHTAGLQKVYRVPVTEEEILQATLDKDSLSIAVIGQADNFNRFVQLQHTAWLPTPCTCNQPDCKQLDPTMPSLHMYPCRNCY